MKKIVFSLITSAIISVTTLANTGTPKAVISNYKSVLSQVEYPVECRENALEGQVLVKLNVDEDGEILSHEIVSSTCIDMTLSVEKVLPLLHFEPVQIEGKIVKSEITIPVTFKLTY